MRTPMAGYVRNRHPTYCVGPTRAFRSELLLQWAKLPITLIFRVRTLEPFFSVTRERWFCRRERRNLLPTVFHNSGPKKMSVMAPMTSKTPK